MLPHHAPLTLSKFLFGFKAWRYAGRGEEADSLQWAQSVTCDLCRFQTFLPESMARTSTIEPVPSFFHDRHGSSKAPSGQAKESFLAEFGEEGTHSNLLKPARSDTIKFLQAWSPTFFIFSQGIMDWQGFKQLSIRKTSAGAQCSWHPALSPPRVLIFCVWGLEGGVGMERGGTPS